MGKLTIGASTGWLHANGVDSLYTQQNILKQAKANALEMVLNNYDNDSENERLTTLLGNESFSSEIFPYQSFHAPDFNTEIDPKIQAGLIKKITKKHSSKITVLHPLKVGKVDKQYPQQFYRMLSSAGIAAAIENMDAKQKSGHSIEELERLMTSHEMSFVLDVEHAFEHDPEMIYAWDLFQAFQNNLAHLHVSGQTENSNHSLVYKSRNTRAIVEFVCKVFDKITSPVPIILEGKYQPYSQELRKEIKFFTQEIGTDDKL